MSITISSTTDSQAEVNAAAGIEAVEETKAPPAENTPRPPEEDPDQDPDDDDGDEEEQPEKPEQPPVPKKKGGWLRKIEALERDRGYMARYIEQMEQALAQQRAGAPQQQNGHQPQQAPDGRPSQEQFETYEAYVDALTDYKVDQRLKTEREKYAAWMQQQQEEQALAGFQQRSAEYNSKVAPDYFETMRSVEHIPVSHYLKAELFESEMGTAVAYELAKHPEELARITRLADRARVAREIGRIEARLQSRETPETPRIMPSKAPAPIRPVGQGANGNLSSKPLDELPLPDYIRAREKQIAAAKRR